MLKKLNFDPVLIQEAVSKRGSVLFLEQLIKGRHNTLLSY